MKKGFLLSFVFWFDPCFLGQLTQLWTCYVLMKIWFISRHCWAHCNGVVLSSLCRYFLSLLRGKNESPIRGTLTQHRFLVDSIIVINFFHYWISTTVFLEHWTFFWKLRIYLIATNTQQTNYSYHLCCWEYGRNKIKLSQFADVYVVCVLSYEVRWIHYWGFPNHLWLLHNIYWRQSGSITLSQDMVKWCLWMHV